MRVFASILALGMAAATGCSEKPQPAEFPPKPQSVKKPLTGHLGVEIHQPEYQAEPLASEALVPDQCVDIPREESSIEALAESSTPIDLRTRVKQLAASNLLQLETIETLNDLVTTSQINQSRYGHLAEHLVALGESVVESGIAENIKRYEAQVAKTKPVVQEVLEFEKRNPAPPIVDGETVI